MALPVAPWQQLCNAITANWWRLPDKYKRELCAIFAVPLGPRNTPLCWSLCECIRENQARLHTCIVFELQRFHTCLLQEGWARYQMQQQWKAIPDGSPEKSVLFGFLMPLEYWLHTRDFYKEPMRVADNELFLSYSLVLMTSSFTGADYLALLAASGASGTKDKTDKTEFKIRRK